MLRVIAGKYGSRKIKDVSSKLTRPTTDKNKESIFNSIGQFFDGGRCLDLFAGSGALGIEAISRGMDHCDFVDKQYRAIKVIRDNVSTLQIEDLTNIHQEDAFHFLKTIESTYDLILIDPPYKLNPYQDCLALIHGRQLLNKHGIIVMESDKDIQIDSFENIIKVKEKVLGRSQISIFRKETL